MEDSNIVALFNARSEQAISELIAKYGASVWKITQNILRDPLDVEECVSDCYLRIWNRIPPEVPRSLGSFACGVARNVALSRYHANTAQKRNSHYDVALDELEACIPAKENVEANGRQRNYLAASTGFSGHSAMTIGTHLSVGITMPSRFRKLPQPCGRHRTGFRSDCSASGRNCSDI